MSKQYYKIKNLKKLSKGTVFIIADHKKLNNEREAIALYEMYRAYIERIKNFNMFNQIVKNTSGFASKENISSDIEVDRNMFDRLYQGALTLNLNIDLTYNSDTGLWYFSVKYQDEYITFINNDNQG